MRKLYFLVSDIYNSSLDTIERFWEDRLTEEEFKRKLNITVAGMTLHGAAELFMPSKWISSSESSTPKPKVNVCMYFVTVEHVSI